MNKTGGASLRVPVEAVALLARVKRLWAKVWNALQEELDSRATYHPEHHYMRGPGPKWHAKHSHVRRTPQPLRFPQD